jgi:thioredoxin-related protein
MNSSRLLAVSIILGFAALPKVVKAQEVAIWHRDYASAVSEAKSKGKALFVVFTGTEWIDLCRKFHDEILSQPAFIDAVSSHFALLKLEYPRDNQLPREEAAEKALLKDAYRVKGFPTVVLTDVDGRPFGLNGYQPVNPEAYAAQISDIYAVHQLSLAALKEAESLDGVAKSKRLIQGIPDLPGNLAARYYRKEMEMIMAGDPDDTLAVAARYSRMIADVEYSRQMQEYARESKWDEMLSLTDRYILENKLEGEILQRALLNKVGVQRQMKDAAGAIRTLERIVGIEAKSEAGAAAQRQLDELRGLKPGGEAKP